MSAIAAVGSVSHRRPVPFRHRPLVANLGQTAAFHYDECVLATRNGHLRKRLQRLVIRFLAILHGTLHDSPVPLYTVQAFPSKA